MSLILVIIYSNYNLYYAPELQKHDGVFIDQDLIKQINYLKKSLVNGVADEMQKQYPEGFFFSHLIYGLTWCELAVNLPVESKLKKKALEEAIFSLNRLESDNCKKNFYKDLPLTYGSFYFNWTNYLRAKILQISDNFSTIDKIVSDFNSNCDTLSKKISCSDSPFFESYPNRSWPADILPGITSLSIHDKLFSPKYDLVIKFWFGKVKIRQNHGENIFPHSVNSKGIRIQNARGSSLGLILILLKEISEIDTDSIYSSYERVYKSGFLDLPMIREYEGVGSATGDIDSGPVVFGYGSVATIIGAGVFKRYGNIDLYMRLNQTIECLGFPYKNSETKKYLFGKIPMADFFIAWVKSLKTLEYNTISMDPDKYWRLPFHIVSLIIVSSLVLLIIKVCRRKRIIKN